MRTNSHVLFGGVRISKYHKNFNETVYLRIKDVPLFTGIALNEFSKMFDCLKAKTQCYQKNEVILLSGDVVDYVGIILLGSVKITKEDRNGNQTILAELFTSDIFSEVFACAGISHSPVAVICSDNCEVLFIDYKRIITACSSICPFHAQLIANMLKLIAKKNLMLNQKNEILSKRTTREKLLLFLTIQRNNNPHGQHKKFTIPYNREELAQYLCVDRSAMSNELCKMRDEGLLLFHRNEFDLL